MARLIIDIDTLHDAGTQLRDVATEFNAADTKAQSIADAVGHESLAVAVRDFAANWDDNRSKMYEQIGNLAEISSGLGDEFATLDTELGAALRGEE